MISLMCCAIRMHRSSQVLLGRAQRLSGDDAVRPGGPVWGITSRIAARGQA